MKQFTLDGLTLSFADVPVLSGITMTGEQGKIHGIIGPSGDGKSVLLKVLGGIYSPASGSIQGIPQERSLMFQEGALFDSLSVFDNVAFPLVDGNVPTTRLGKARRAEVRDTVLTTLARVGLDWACAKMPGELSGGMRRRVSFARALVTRPSMLLLDDPTSGLDPVASSVIMNLIGEVQAETECTVLIVSHDLRRLLPHCTKMFALFDGVIIFSGSVEELLTEGPQRVKSFVECRYDFEQPNSVTPHGA